MVQFPVDIVADILSRLAVEPLLRFRSVSKPWCSLIDSPHFIKLHLKRSIETNCNRKVLLNDGHSLSMYSLDVAVESPLKECRNIKQYYPYSSVSGSCDGLVLLYLREDYVAIWNPSTRKEHILPPIGTANNDKFITEDFYGLGYDSVRDDYKVVKITQFVDQNGVLVLPSELQVYSLKTKSWTDIVTDLSFYLCFHKPTFGVFVSGALHWIASEGDDGDRLIVAFDLATQEYRIVGMPSFLGDGDCHNDHRLDVKLVSLEGCLCICSKNLDAPVVTNVRVMKHYGVQESWTKLLSVSHTKTFSCEVPVAFSMDGTKVLLGQERKNLSWYDLKHKVVEAVNIPGFGNVHHAVFCVPSLVPPGRDDNR